MNPTEKARLIKETTARVEDLYRTACFYEDSGQFTMAAKYYEQYEDAKDTLEELEQP